MKKTTYQITKQKFITSEEYRKLVTSTPLYNNFKWDKKTGLYKNKQIVEKKSKFKQTGEVMGFDMRGIK